MQPEGWTGPTRGMLEYKSLFSGSARVEISGITGEVRSPLEDCSQRLRQTERKRDTDREREREREREKEREWERERERERVAVGDNRALQQRPSQFSKWRGSTVGVGGGEWNERSLGWTTVHSVSLFHVSLPLCLYSFSPAISPLLNSRCLLVFTNCCIHTRWVKLIHSNLTVMFALHISSMILT